MSITDLLNSTTQEDTIRHFLPVANYVAKIAKADVLPGYLGPKEGKRAPGEEVYSLHYVPTFEIIEYLSTGNTELDETNLAQLEAFGDWRGFRLSSSYPKAVPTIGPDKIRLAGFDAGNYELKICDEHYGSDETTAWSKASRRLPSFAETCLDGSTKGFITILSKDPKMMVPIDLPENFYGPNLQKTIAATEDAYLVISIGVKHSEQRGPENFVEGVSSVG